MVHVQFDLYHGWDTIEEAIDFFLNLCLELTALKKLPDAPSKPFVSAFLRDEELTDEQCDKMCVTLELN